MKIKSHIKQICKNELNIKQVDFIRRMDGLGVSRNTAVDVFNGKTNVQLWTIAAACKALSIPMDKAISFE